MIRFEWDEQKNQANQRKHRVSFDEAQTVFFDEDAVEYHDLDRSEDQERFLLVGRSFKLRVLIVCHCLRESASVIRIISARRATKRERQFYTRRGKP